MQPLGTFFDPSGAGDGKTWWDSDLHRPLKVSTVSEPNLGSVAVWLLSGLPLHNRGPNDAPIYPCNQVLQIKIDFLFKRKEFNDELNSCRQNSCWHSRLGPNRFSWPHVTSPPWGFWPSLPSGDHSLGSTSKTHGDNHWQPLIQEAHLRKHNQHSPRARTGEVCDICTPCRIAHQCIEDQLEVSIFRGCFMRLQESRNYDSWLLVVSEKTHASLPICIAFSCNTVRWIPT